MDVKTPWTGGVSNRKIFVDTIRSLVVWVAIFVSLSVLYWWVSGYIDFGKTNARVPICIALIGALSTSLTRWCRA